MLLLPPSVAKREPELSELSSLIFLIHLYEDDLPVSCSSCSDVKWRGNIEEEKCYAVKPLLTTSPEATDLLTVTKLRPSSTELMYF